MVGLSLVEVLVVLLIIAIIAGITVPVLAHARKKGASIECLANIRSNAHAYALYSVDHDGKGIWVDHSIEYIWPDWISSLRPYVKKRGEIRCPSVSDSEYRHFCRDQESLSFCYTGYAMNMVLTQEFVARDPSKVILFGEVQSREIQSPGRSQIVNRALIHTIDELHCRADLYPRPITFCDNLAHGHSRHMGGSHIALLDGHVRWLKRPQYRLRFFTDTRGFYRYEGPVDGPRFHLEE